ncbi:MAG: hypothetical protein EXS03_08465 [Phycisphaerales bacterium]|nr:hypothetical protein [Phycisphaerales bacterium]
MIPGPSPNSSGARRGGCCSGRGCGCLLITAILIALCIWGGVRACNSLKTWVRDNLSLVQSSATTTLTSALGELRAKGGLQIGWRTIDTHLEIDRTTTVGAFGYSIPVGAVHIRIDVPGNRVQYLIPVDPPWQIHAVDGATFLLTLPPPEVNEDVVEVQSDPAKFRIEIDNDWAEHLIPSGGDVDEAKRLLRSSVIETGKSKPALAEVRMEAREVAGAFVRGVLAGAGIASPKVIVLFTDEANPRE